MHEFHRQLVQGPILKISDALHQLVIENKSVLLDPHFERRFYGVDLTNR